MLILSLLISLVFCYEQIDSSNYMTKTQKKDCLVFFYEENSKDQLGGQFKLVEEYFSKRMKKRFNYFSMDIKANDELFKTFKLQGPGICMYLNGTLYDTDEIIFAQIKNAILYFLGIHYDEAKNQDDYDLALSTSHSVMIHYGNKTEEFKEFCKNIVVRYSRCLIVKSKKLKKTKKLDKNYHTAIYQRWSDEKFYFDFEFSIENWQQFFDIYSRKLVEEMNQEIFQQLFSKKMSVMVLFQPRYNLEYVKQFMKHSFDFRIQGEKNFIFLVNQKESEHNLEFFIGLQQYNEPLTYMITFEKDGIKKYLFNDTKHTSAEFMEEWRQGNLIRYVKSEDIPDYENDKDPIRSIVHYNFNQTLESDKEILLLMYEKRQTKHQQVLDVLYKVNNITQKLKNFEILKIDVYMNEMEKWEPPYIPAVLFVPKKARNSPIEYKSPGSEFVVEEVIAFLEKQLNVNILELAFQDSEKFKNVTHDDFDDKIFIDDDQEL